jgi:hypothetical protein
MTVSQTVDASGGSVVLPDGARLDIPAGALSRALTLSILSTTSDPPGGYSTYSPVYGFYPQGTQFNVPVTVTLPFVSGAKAPSVFWSRDSGVGYDELGGTTRNRTISAHVMHFSQGFVAQSQGAVAGQTGLAGSGVAGVGGAGTGGGGAGGAGAGGAGDGGAGAGGAGEGGGQAGGGAGGGAGAGAGGTGGGGGATALCSFGDTVAVDIAPFVRAPVVGSTSLDASTRVTLAADGSVHLATATQMFAAADGQHFRPINPAAVQPGYVDGARSVTYYARQDASGKWMISSYGIADTCAINVFHDNTAAGLVSLSMAGISLDTPFAIGSEMTVSQPTLFIGRNQGASWMATSPLPAGFTPLHAAMSQSNPNRLWVGGSSDSLGKVAVSTDGGATWSLSAVPGDGTQTGAGAATVLPDVQNELVAYALVTGAAAGLYRTADGGLTWHAAAAIAPPAGESFGTTMLLSDGSLLTITATGLKQQSRGAGSWVSLDGDLPIAERGGGTFGVRETSGQPLTILRIAASGLPYASSDGGVHYTTGGWSGLPSLVVPSALATSPDDAHVFYANDHLGHVFRTEDGGVSFAQVAVGFHGVPFVLSGGGLLVYGAPDGSGTAGLYASADAGATVTPAGTGLPADAFTQVNDAHELIVAGKATGSAYVMYGLAGADAASRGQLFVSTDGGANFAKAGNYLPSQTSGQGFVVADPAVAQRLYRFMIDTQVTSTFSISSDDGLTWVDHPLPPSGSADVVVPTEVAVGADGRLYLADQAVGANTLPPGALAWVALPNAPVALAPEVLGDALFLGGQESSDEGTTFVAVDAHSIQALLLPDVVASRADGTLWLGDLGGVAAPQGLLIGRP